MHRRAPRTIDSPRCGLAPTHQTTACPRKFYPCLNFLNLSFLLISPFTPFLAPFVSFAGKYICVSMRMCAAIQTKHTQNTRAHAQTHTSAHMHRRTARTPDSPRCGWRQSTKPQQARGRSLEILRTQRLRGKTGSATVGDGGPGGSGGGCRSTTAGICQGICLKRESAENSDLR